MEIITKHFLMFVGIIFIGIGFVLVIIIYIKIRKIRNKDCIKRVAIDKSKIEDILESPVYRII